MNAPPQHPAASPSLGPGVVVDRRYSIIRELGRGGMGTVYEAEQIQLGKRVALKVMLSGQPGQSPASPKRFLREARVASSIKHRNVVDTTDFGDLEGGSTYYVMELLQGRDLSSLLKAEGPMPWPRVRTILHQVLSGLSAAHDQGIIHRDIKPANIVLLDQPDQWGKEWVKVLDFGIAKIQQADEESQALTGTSEILGTAKYMAPELVRGDPPDARTDLYAVGIVAYQLLTGSAPFEEPNTFKLLMQHVKEAPRPPSQLRPQVPTAVDALVLRTLAKDPGARFQTAAQMRAALDELGDDPAPLPGGTQIAFDVPAGGTMLAEPARAHPPASTPSPVERRAAPAPLAAPQFGAAPPPMPAPKNSGLKPWMVLIPILAIGAGIAVGLFM